MTLALLDTHEKGRREGQAQNYWVLAGNGELQKSLKSWEEHDQIWVLERHETEWKMDWKYTIEARRLL